MESETLFKWVKNAKLKNERVVYMIRSTFRAIDILSCATHHISHAGLGQVLHVVGVVCAACLGVWLRLLWLHSGKWLFQQRRLSSHTFRYCCLLCMLFCHGGLGYSPDFLEINK